MDAVNAVLLEKQSLSAVLDRLRRDQPQAASNQVAGAQDLTYGVLRQYGRLGFFLRALLARPPDPPTLTGLLLVALYEISSPETPDYAAVNEAVNLASRRFPRARGLVNGVLRAFQRQREELERRARLDPEASLGFPLWWQERLQANYPNHWRGILETMNGHPPMTLRVNRTRCSPAGYAAQLDRLSMPYRVTGEYALTLEQPVPVRKLPGFDAGLISVQDLGAQLAAPLLQAEDGMRVLDACAAPGGKTAHLLESHTLDMTALDCDPVRLAKVADNLERLGLSARLLPADAGRPDSWWDGQAFQRILLDAPCTASGVVRRHPDGKWLKRPEDATQLAAVQAQLLDAVWPLLGPGGKLLYATCSLFSEENESQADSFLKRHPDARRETLDLPGGMGGQLLPSEDQDGFFYARFIKA